VLSQLKKLVRSSEDDYLHGSPREAAVEAHVTNVSVRCRCAVRMPSDMFRRRKPASRLRR
jgi:hypothetical protein